MTDNHSMIQYDAARAREYDRMYEKPERQEEWKELEHVSTNANIQFFDYYWIWSYRTKW